MNINLALLLLDYSPGGMLMPDRYSSINVYRYGFQGQEKDDEVSGEGNSYDFGARMYNSRVSRFFGMDPVIQSHQSPYLYAANNPIYYVDLDGKDNIVYVVVLNSSHPDYVINAKEIKDDLNKMYEKLGVNTRAVIFDESVRGKFDPDNTDFNDSYAFVGNEKDVVARGVTPREGALETSEHMSSDIPGQWIGVFYETLADYTGITSDVNMLIAFAIAHGSGHNASGKKKHTYAGDSDLDVNYLNYMSDGNIVNGLFMVKNDIVTDEHGTNTSVNYLKESNPEIKELMDLFDSSRNKENIKRHKKRTKGNVSKDNYFMNDIDRNHILYKYLETY